MLSETTQKVEVLKGIQQEENDWREIESRSAVNRLVGWVIKQATRKMQEWKELKASHINSVLRETHSFKRVEGIFLWGINRQLKKIAKENIHEKNLTEDKIVIPVPAKKTNELTSDYQKEMIEQMIDQLEGLEFLRVVMFQFCKPVYKEQRVFSEVTRTIEIHISNNEINSERNVHS